jgi:hypothetical protein
MICRYRNETVEKKVTAGAHTLDELVQYAMNRHNLIETDPAAGKYIEKRKNLKRILKIRQKDIGRW